MTAKIIDRYPLVLDCRPQVGHWANLYKEGQYYHPEPNVAALWRKETLRAFDKIKEEGIDVCFSSRPQEPYATSEEMRERVLRSGIFICRWRNPGHHLLGHDHKAFRVVHDYFGHLKGELPFNMEGEVDAFQSHRQTKLFSFAVLPLVWSEVVLENAYRLYHGHWYWHSKPVLDPHWGHAEL